MSINQAQADTMRRQAKLRALAFAAGFRERWYGERLARLRQQQEDIQDATQRIEFLQSGQQLPPGNNQPPQV